MPKNPENQLNQLNQLNSKNIENTDPVSNASNTATSNYKVSVRLIPGNKIVTSISINTKLLSLWLLISVITKMESDPKEAEVLIKKVAHQSSLRNYISDFIHKKLTYWNKDSGKGLSDYISSCIYFEICKCLEIDTADFTEFYNNVIKELQG